MATTLATARESQPEDFTDPERGTIRRTPDQNKNRVVNSKDFLQNKPLSRFPTAANDDVKVAANDNEEDQENSRIAEAQSRVARLRVIRSTNILAPQEEAEHQIAREKGNSPNLIWYLPAFSVAFFKDLLDLIGIGSLPLIGTVITFFCSVLMFILLSFAKKNGSLFSMRFIIIFLLGFLVEAFLPGVNFFPFQIITIAIIYLMDKHLSDSQIAALQKISNVLGGKKL